jgi:hypothetical protein
MLRVSHMLTTQTTAHFVVQIGSEMMLAILHEATSRADYSVIRGIHRTAAKDPQTQPYSNGCLRNDR